MSLAGMTAAQAVSSMVHALHWGGVKGAGGVDYAHGVLESIALALHSQLSTWLA